MDVPTDADAVPGPPTAGRAPREAAARTEDAALVAALREGDEARYAELVTALTPTMIRVARMYVPTRAIAEDVVGESWLAVLNGLDRFEGRSSARTWILGIVVNIAKSRGRRERRTVPFSSAFPDETGPTVDPSRFHPPGAEWPGHWAAPPRRWEVPESALLSREMRVHLREAMDQLPPRQRTVLSLRDVQGLEADEVGALLGISAGNQRVLLHRARAKMRQALEAYLDDLGTRTGSST